MLVLDETTMLDPWVEMIMKILKKLNINDNITIVLITHHMDETAQAQELYN